MSFNKLSAGSSVHINQTVDLLVNNYNLTLDCDTTKCHKNCSTIEWKRDSEAIHPSIHYIFTNNYSLLIIVNLTIADAGLYQCTMYDRVKISINTIRVIVKGMYVCIMYESVIHI